MKKIIFKSLFIISSFLILNSTLLIRNCQSQWVNYTLPYDGIVARLGFSDVNTGAACGNTVNPWSARFYYTTNAGINWMASTFPSTLRSTVDVQFINSTLVYACGAENTGVNNFKYYKSGFTNLPDLIKNRLMISGINNMSSESKAAFIKSTNAGVSWQKVSTFENTTNFMMNIHFFDANTGYCLVDTGSVDNNTFFYKTTNAGINWQLVRMIEARTMLNNMYFTDMNTGFASGITSLTLPSSHGAIYKTTNAGLNWVKTDFIRTSQIQDITFLNSTTGIAVGIEGDGLLSESMSTKIYRTTNGGAQWDSIYSLTNHFIENIESLPSTGTVFGTGNLVDSIIGFTKLTTIKTTNYGASWVLNDLNQITIGTGVTLIDQNNFIMGGGDLNLNPSVARILKSTNGGNVFVNQIAGEVPDTYSLSQNYPNPFNPVTRIRYDLPRSGSVRLAVYDVMGREVEMLVNEKQAAGSYEATFDGTRFASGVYFAKLESGTYNHIIKMIMLK
jgi:photosystem II stability/assembly factor-like uncharacterized protein